LALIAEEEKKKKVEERSKEKGKEQEKDKKNSQEKGKEQGKDEEKEIDVKVLSAAEKIIVVEDAIRVLKEHTSFKSLLGQCGVVKGLQKGGNVDIAFDNYKQHGLATKTLPALLVEHKGAPFHAQDLQTLARKPRWIKKQLAQAAGAQDPSWSVLTTVEKGCQFRRINWLCSMPVFLGAWGLRVRTKSRLSLPRLLLA
jgi:hypothetical protein